jgi:hypothetical protein
MTKLKSLFALFCIATVLYACDQNLNTFINPFEDVDYEVLSVSDNNAIVTFLESHYFDADSDSIKAISEGQPSLFSDKTRLKEVPVNQNNIDYTLYVYVSREGIDNAGKGKPTELDSVFVNRKGYRLLDNDIYTTNFDSQDQTWWSLANTFGLSGIAASPIIAWTKGFPELKPGENITSNGPIKFQNTGKAYFFVPSGLAYPSINFQPGQNPNAFRYDQILVFQVELLDFVKDTDHDNDGKPSSEEGVDSFSDPLLPNLPDYLNPNY